MPEINLPTSAKQDQIKTTVDAIRVDTTQIKEKVNEPAPNSKVLKSKVFETDGTFRTPAGVTEVYVTGCGGGGGGGNMSPYSEGRSGGITSFGSVLSLSGGAGGLTGAGINSGASGGSGGGSGSGSGFGGNSYGGGGGPGISQVGSIIGIGGGGAQCVLDCPIPVSPNTSYSIKIGIGGAGAAGDITLPSYKGGDGGYGAGGGGSATSDGGKTGIGGKGGNGIMIVKWWE